MLVVEDVHMMMEKSALSKNVKMIFLLLTHMEMIAMLTTKIQVGVDSMILPPSFLEDNAAFVKE